MHKILLHTFVEFKRYPPFLRFQFVRYDLNDLRITSTSLVFYYSEGFLFQSKWLFETMYSKENAAEFSVQIIKTPSTLIDRNQTVLYFSTMFFQLWRREGTLTQRRSKPSANQRATGKLKVKVSLKVINRFKRSHHQLKLIS